MGFDVGAEAYVPGVDVRGARAEALPFPDGSVDVTFGQLVVHFLSDPVRGLLPAAPFELAASAWTAIGTARPPVAG